MMAMASAKVKANIKGLEKLAGKLNKLSGEQLNLFNEDSIKELAARLLRKVILRTPVGQYPASSGKVGGTLRRGWTVGEVVKDGHTYTIEIINPVEYGIYVEFGHRTINRVGWVDGRFMLTISEQELEADAPRILENKLKNFFEGILNA